MDSTDKNVLLAFEAIFVTAPDDTRTWRERVRAAVGRDLNPDEVTDLKKKVAEHENHDHPELVLKIENYPP